ncbi:hypothetical protein L0F63_006271 [Massospora cicadina]|nr:hypothetical protein L0F63_006271 [Massospora cicadina]
MSEQNVNSRLSVFLPPDPEAQSISSLQGSRISSSFSRSYYSNLKQVTDDEPATYTQDKETIRSQTLALANQGLKAVSDEGFEPTQFPTNFAQPRGYLSNLSQLINSQVNNQSASASQVPSNLNSPQPTPAIVCTSVLENSDEEDFEEALRPISPILKSNKSNPTSPSKILNPTATLKARPKRTPSSPAVDQPSLPNKKPPRSFEPDPDLGYSPAIPRIWRGVSATAISSVPAVLIGTLLNILDSVSFGLIIFPTALPEFADFGPDGIAIFLVSTVIAQLVYSGGGSTFGGGNGGFMIEVVPFLHIIGSTVIEDLGEPGRDMVVPTTLVAYALSSVVTGLAFFGLGWFKLGSLMEFFPRHILIGCIGGVGLFLIATGIMLTADVMPSFDWKVWGKLFSGDVVPLWGLALALALTLQTLARSIRHQFLAPAFFFMIPVAFYLWGFAAGFEVEQLRERGWVFPLPTPVKPFYDFYLNFSLARTSWATLPKLVPAILSLTFFGILHVPINVPALAASTGMHEVDINRELVCHGVSNIVSGCFGSVQNYLIYSNSVLFARSGGDNRVAGLLLCFTTLGVLMMGPGIIGFIPRCLVGALIFHLGIELMKEALWDTLGVVHPLEYVTVVVIVVVMGTVGFTEGIVLGIVLACLFFVVIYSQRTPVRAVTDGTRVRSTVRRLYHQRTFLEGVGDQVQVMYLQGFMFFGTVHQLDHAITTLLRSYRHHQSPVRFLVLDFSLVSGIDFSATDAFSRILHRLSSHGIFLVVAGVALDSDIGLALRKSGLWSSSDSSVQHFEKCNQALEWCENTLLASLYQMTPAIPVQRVNSTLIEAYPAIEARYSTSPRDRQLHEAALKAHTQVNDTTALVKNARQPLGLLLQAFQGISDFNYPSLHQLSRYFEPVEMVRNQVLWRANDAADALYIVEQGLLRISAIANKANGASYATDSALPGTLVGEVTFLTNQRRTTTTYVDSENALVWRLTWEAYQSILDLAASDPSSPEASIPYLLTKLALAYTAYDNRLYSDLAHI